MGRIGASCVVKSPALVPNILDLNLGSTTSSWEVLDSKLTSLGLSFLIGEIGTLLSQVSCEQHVVFAAAVRMSWGPWRRMWVQIRVGVLCGLDAGASRQATLAGVEVPAGSGSTSVSRHTPSGWEGSD